MTPYVPTVLTSHKFGKVTDDIDPAAAKTWFTRAYHRSTRESAHFNKNLYVFIHNCSLKIKHTHSEKCSEEITTKTHLNYTVDLT